MKKLNTRMITVIGVLIAMEVILSRFLSINAPSVKIGFAFVPCALCAVLFGLAPTVILEILADLLGATLFPSGSFFPGFTLTAALRGLSYGLLLGKKQTPARILMVVLFNQLVLGLCVNTLWISILYGSSFAALLVTRVVQCVVLIPVEFVVITAIVKFGKRIKKV
jgi:ECF transporter S component (folate family)